VATITLTGATAYSAIVGLVDGDTIDCAGFALTLDIQPTHSTISVVSPGTAGTVVFAGAWNIPTWSFTCGGTSMIATLPIGATVGNVSGGATASTNCVTTNNGTIAGSVTGGSGSNAFAVNSNNGTITGNVTGGSVGRAVNTNAGTITGGLTGGSGATAFAVNINSGTITGSVTGGSVVGAAGIQTNTGLISGNVFGTSTAGVFSVTNNNGTITGNVTGGSAANCDAVSINSGTITGLCTGGTNSTANAVQNNYGNCIGGLVDSTANAVAVFTGTTHLVHGPLTQVTIPATITTLYSLFGPLHASAVVGPGTTVTVLQTGGSTRPSNPFLQQVIG